MSDHTSDVSDKDSLRTLTDEEVVTERRVPRRSFLSASGALVAGAIGVVLGERASAQSTDTKSKPNDPPKSGDTDKSADATKSTDGEKSSDADKSSTDSASDTKKKKKLKQPSKGTKPPAEGDPDI